MQKTEELLTKTIKTFNLLIPNLKDEGAKQLAALEILLLEEHLRELQEEKENK